MKNFCQCAEMYLRDFVNARICHALFRRREYVGALIECALLSVNRFFSLTEIWPFGRFFCPIWVKLWLVFYIWIVIDLKGTVDDVTTMANGINIVATSLNRHWSIAFPISYRKSVRPNWILIVWISIWLISFSKIDNILIENDFQWIFSSFCFWTLVVQCVWKEKCEWWFRWF